VGSNSLTINGAFEWSGGTISNGPTNIAAGGVLNVLGNNSATLSGALLHNFGTINLTAGSDLWRLGNAALILNESGGVFNLAGDGQVFADAGNFGSVVNSVGAAIRKTGGSDISIFNAPITNDGLVQAQTGTLRFSAGGSGSGVFDVAAGALLEFNNGYGILTGAALTGDGYTRVSGGNFSVDGTVNAHRFELAGGTLAINTSSSFTFGTTDIGDLRVGQVTGSGTLGIGSGGTLNIFGNNSVTLAL
jgi:hypothetical protein